MPHAPRIALLFLCHEAPAVVARRLATPFFVHPDVATYIHYDGARPAQQREELRRLLPTGGRFVFVEEPVACRWGEHTLVEATRRLMTAALADPVFVAEHLALLSASCVPYRPVASLQAYLGQRAGIEFIQARDIREGRWVKDGLERERFEFYFPFNYRTRRSWFEWATERQREFNIQRRVPDGLDVHFGSQWFCLTRATAAAVAQDLARPDIRRWLRWSWIPDEFAVQTLVARHCPRSRIAGHNLTYYEFDDQGHPLVLENGHQEHLMAQPFFFARKVAPEADRLEADIAEHTRQPEADLAYFPRVGQATAAFARYEMEAACGTAQSSHLGVAGGAMASNRRRYYVLHASSDSWLKALLAAARGQTRLPIFDAPFDAEGVCIAAGASHRGLGPGDTPRRDHDLAAYLFEVVNVDGQEPSAFGLEICLTGVVREIVRQDRRAVLIDCDPPLTREQKAATLLRTLDQAAAAPALRAIIESMRDGTPLPAEAFINDPKQHKACQAAILRDFGPELGDATLLALRNAYHSLDPAAHHVTHDAAWRQFWK